MIGNVLKSFAKSTLKQVEDLSSTVSKNAQNAPKYLEMGKPNTDPIDALSQRVKVAWSSGDATTIGEEATQIEKILTGVDLANTNDEMFDRLSSLAADTIESRGPGQSKIKEQHERILSDADSFNSSIDPSGLGLFQKLGAGYKKMASALDSDGNYIRRAASYDDPVFKSNEDVYRSLFASDEKTTRILDSIDNENIDTVAYVKKIHDDEQVFFDEEGTASKAIIKEYENKGFVVTQQQRNRVNLEAQAHVLNRQISELTQIKSRLGGKDIEDMLQRAEERLGKTEKQLKEFFEIDADSRELESLNGRRFSEIDMTPVAMKLISRQHKNTFGGKLNVFIGENIPSNLNPKEVEELTNSISMGSYFYSRSGGLRQTPKTIEGVLDFLQENELISSIPSKEMVSFLSHKLNRALRNDAFMGRVHGTIEQTPFFTLSEKGSLSGLSRDFRLKKKERAEMIKKAGRYNRAIERNKETAELNPAIIDIGPAGIKTANNEIEISTSDLEIARKTITDRSFLESAFDNLKVSVPLIKKLLPNDGASAGKEFRKALQPLRGGVAAVLKDVTDSFSKANLSGTNYNKDLIGAWHFPVDGKSFSPQNKLAHELLEQLDEYLSLSGYTKSDMALQTRVTRKTPMFSSDEISDVSRKLQLHFGETKDIHMAMKKTIGEYSGKNILEYEELVKQVADPKYAARVALGDRLRIISQMQFVRTIRDDGMFALSPRPGFVKMNPSEIDPHIIEAFLGSKSIYVPAEEAAEFGRIAKEYTESIAEDLSSMAKKMTISGNRAVRGFMLMGPSTRVTAEVGNALLAVASGVTGVSEYFSLKRFVRAQRKGFTPLYQEFLQSGLAAPEINVASMSGNASDVSSGPGRFNVFNPDSAMADVAYKHLLAVPDLELRMMIFLKGKKNGWSTEDMQKLVSRTLGNTDELPSIAKSFAEFPGGDIFFRYTWTMAKNFGLILVNNPKQFAKVAVGLAAMQQASMFLFMSPEDRERVRKDPLFKPSLFKALTLDPSFADPTGKYNAMSYMSPFSLSIDNGNGNVVSKTIRSVWEGKSANDIMKDNLKIWRKMNQASDHLSNGEYLKAIKGQASITEL